MILDSFILTFKGNSEPCIVMYSGVIKPAPWLYELTEGRAQYIGKKGKEIEIAVPVWDFLKIKDKPHFQSKCCTLVRLRTTPRSFLGYLCFPLRDIDNRLK